MAFQWSPNQNPAVHHSSHLGPFWPKQTAPKNHQNDQVPIQVTFIASMGSFCSNFFFTSSSIATKAEAGWVQLEVVPFGFPWQVAFWWELLWRIDIPWIFSSEKKHNNAKEGDFGQPYSLPHITLHGSSKETMFSCFGNKHFL